tara:strand:+ start:821 stop:1177 length:357 start_codon:yes stop_codon:yes gene_type:complete
MTNLSELLPAGAASKQLSFTADGAIAQGDTVSLETNGKVKKITSANSNLARFIGLADAAISDTASGKVTMKGGIAANGLSSLTPGATYFVQNDGTLSTASSSVTAGKALAATTLLLKG